MKLKTQDNRFDNICNAARCAQDKDLVAYAPGVAFPKAEGQVTLCPDHVARRDKERAAEAPADKAIAAAPAMFEAQDKMEAELATEARDAKEILAMVRSFQVNGQEDINFANGCLGDVKDKLKELKSKREEATRPMNAALKAIRGWFKPAEEFYTEAEGIWKEKIRDGLSALEARQRAALNAAAEAHQAGDLSSVTEAMVVASQATASAPANVSIVRHWTFTITDEALIPREYLTPDLQKIGAVVRAMGDQANIPGVRADRDDTVVRR